MIKKKKKQIKTHACCIRPVSTERILTLFNQTDDTMSEPYKRRKKKHNNEHSTQTMSDGKKSLNYSPIVFGFIRAAWHCSVRVVAGLARQCYFYVRRQNCVRMADPATWLWILGKPLTMTPLSLSYPLASPLHSGVCGVHQAAVSAKKNIAHRCLFVVVR